MLGEKDCFVLVKEGNGQETIEQRKVLPVHHLRYTNGHPYFAQQSRVSTLVMPNMRDKGFRS